MVRELGADPEDCESSARSEQIIHQFVSVNGPDFVRVNAWLPEFLAQPKPLPDDVFVYAYAMKEHAMRFVGFGGTICLEDGVIDLVSEFSRWPLGTVLSFTELRDKRLSPIRDWARLEKRSTTDLPLRVNHVAGHQPLDFRTPADLLLASFKVAGSQQTVRKELLEQMIMECERRTGVSRLQFNAVAPGTYRTS